MLAFAGAGVARNPWMNPPRTGIASNILTGAEGKVGEGQRNYFRLQGFGLRVLIRRRGGDNLHSFRHFHCVSTNTS